MSKLTLCFGQTHGFTQPLKGLLTYPPIVNKAPGYYLLVLPFIIMDIFSLEFVFSFFLTLRITHRNQIERNNIIGQGQY